MIYGGVGTLDVNSRTLESLAEKLCAASVLLCIALHEDCTDRIDENIIPAQVVARWCGS